MTRRDKERITLAITTLDEVMEWKHCPLCGRELVEVYPGDFACHTNCDDIDCEGAGFHLATDEGGNIEPLTPSRRLYW